MTPELLKISWSRLLGDTQASGGALEAQDLSAVKFKDAERSLRAAGRCPARSFSSGHKAHSQDMLAAHPTLFSLRTEEEAPEEAEK